MPVHLGFVDTLVRRNKEIGKVEERKGLTGAKNNQPFDAAKFKALVHYIVWKCSDPAKLGATKLNKILWFSDARAYMVEGAPITGATYIREKWGPVPRQMKPIRDEMYSDGVIHVTRQPLFNRGQDIYATRTAPDMSGFSKEEMQIVDYWIEEICERHTATSASELSHDYAWSIARMGEEVPLYALRVNRIKRELTDEECERLRGHAKEIGLI